MGENAQEIELKFAVPPERAEAVWAAFAPADAAQSKGKTLVSTYFDTPDRRLSAAGMALRIRDDGKTRIQTLKGSPEGGFARAEYEQAVEGPGIDAAALAETPAAAVLEGAAVEPLFTVEVRRRKAVVMQGASQVEICLDTGWVEGGDRREAICEIELELLRGSPSALFALGRRLMQGRRSVELAFETKGGRGFRLVDGAKHERAAIKPSMDTATAFTAIGEAALADIAGACAELATEISPKGVHDLRVGLRRLRSARSTFKAMLVDPESERVASELKWLAHALDEMRDLDVLAESVADADAAFHGVLEAARAAARERLHEALNSPRRRALPLKTAEWLTVGRWRRSPARDIRQLRERPIAELAAEALDKRLSKLDPKEDLGALPVERRHHECIKIKKLRYAADAFAALFDEHPKRRKRMIAAFKEAQACLGLLNDDAVGRRIAHRLVAASGDAEAAFAAGAAFAPDPRREAKRLKAAQAAWDEMFADRPFWR